MDTERPTPEQEPEEEERLSGTLSQVVQRLLSLIGGMSALLAILGAVALVVGGGLWLFVPQMRAPGLTVVALGGVLLLMALLVSFDAVRVAVLGRRGRYGTNTAIMIAAFLVLVGLVNLLATRNPVRMDVTATKQFSLSAQSRGILRSLPEPVEAVAFFVPGDPLRGATMDLLHEFQVRSDGFSARAVDPEAEPAVARRYNVTQYPVVVFEGLTSGRRAPVRISSPGDVEERPFATAVLIATGKEQKRVYILTGYGEKEPTDENEGSSKGFGFALRGLQGDNYIVLPLDLRQQCSLLAQPQECSVPEDAAALVVPGPTQDIRQDHMEVLFEYLRNGGRAVLLLDPQTPQSWRDLLARWGVGLGEGSVVDTRASVSGDPRTLVVTTAQYWPTPVTQGLGTTYFPDATDIEPTTEDMPATIGLVPLAFTSQDSWLTPDPKSNEFSEGRDKRGPLAMGTLVQALAPLEGQPIPSGETFKQTNMVIVGDSDFASNQFFYASGNGDLFLNSVNWLTEDVHLIAARPKPFVFRELVLTSQEARFVQYSSWFLLPLAVAVIGAVAWWRRQQGL